MDIDLPPTSTSAPKSGRPDSRILLGYAILLTISIAAFLAIVRIGASLTPYGNGVQETAQQVSEPTSASIPRLVIAFAIIVITARAGGFLLQRFSQPAVIGEIVAGIALGPSVFGALSVGAQSALFPRVVVDVIAMIAQAGVILYMFVVGLDLDPKHLRTRAKTMIVAAHASIAGPFVLGGALALFLYPRYASGNVSFLIYALFIGAAMSVTAFPVLARILSERGLSRTPIGNLAMGAAAIDDVTAWLLLGFVVSVANPEKAIAPTTTLAALTLYFGTMLLIVRPAMQRFVAYAERLTKVGITLAAIAIIVLAFGSSQITARLGLHALFGAFFFGAILSRDAKLPRDLKAQLERWVLLLLLPAFFALTGLKTDIGALSSASHWIACALVIAIACLGKIGATAAAAKGLGLEAKDAWSLGVLMNTRGLMGLVVISVGRELDVISSEVFTMMVLMALVTTFMTSPLLDRIRGRATTPMHSSATTSR